jgi:hypothetical protein
VAELVLRLGSQNDVIHENENVPLLALFQQFLLLVQQLVDEGLIPLVKKEARVPLGVFFHHCLQNGAASGRSHEPHDQIEVVKQSVH